MILSESLSKDWIQSKVQQFKGSDPVIVEKVIRALVLLETLKSVTRAPSNNGIGNPELKSNPEFSPKYQIFVSFCPLTLTQKLRTSIKYKIKRNFI